MARIFLCHASEDKPQVEEIYDRLLELGFDPWMDKRELIPGQNWERQIRLALKESYLVLIFLSRQSIAKRGYVQREFKLALDVLQEMPEDVIHTIPVRLEECRIPDQFASLQWCDFFVPDGFDRLVEAIRYGLELRGETVTEPPEPSSTQDAPYESMELYCDDAQAHDASSAAHVSGQAHNENLTWKFKDRRQNRNSDATTITTAGILISYRREDSSGYAGRLYDRLSDRFGAHRLFMDIDTIQPGSDFVHAIEQAVGNCDVVLVLIGNRWLRSVDENGRPRLENPQDFVRLEIETALHRGIHVIPVLVEGVSMPRVAQLPKELQSLARRQALEITDTRFHIDVDRLIGVLEKVLAEQSAARRCPRRLIVMISILSVLVGILVVGMMTPSLKDWISSGLPEKESMVFPQSNPCTPVPSETLTNSIGMEFVLIPAGSFKMGTPGSVVDAIARSYDIDRSWIANEVPQHRVYISEPFYLSKYEVTQGQWEAVMDENPSGFKGDPNRPVERISWEQLHDFIKELNEREGITDYRLPTEAEWEYAARAGSYTSYSFGDDAAQLGDYAWYWDNAGNTTHPVGQLRPNAWCLYDMHGNVWEWVQDWYYKGYYQNSPEHDPPGPDTGERHMLRGGSWVYDAVDARSARRLADSSGTRNHFSGFRLARALAPQRIRGAGELRQTTAESVRTYKRGGSGVRDVPIKKTSKIEANQYEIGKILSKHGSNLVVRDKDGKKYFSGRNKLSLFKVENLCLIGNFDIIMNIDWDNWGQRIIFQTDKDDDIVVKFIRKSDRHNKESSVNIIKYGEISKEVGDTSWFTGEHSNKLIFSFIRDEIKFFLNDKFFHVVKRIDNSSVKMIQIEGIGQQDKLFSLIITR